MVDTNALRAEMSRFGITQKAMAKILGVSEKTLYLKMKSGVFNTDEAQIMVETLHITRPADIFFAKRATHKVAI